MFPVLARGRKQKQRRGRRDDAQPSPTIHQLWSLNRPSTSKLQASISNKLRPSANRNKSLSFSFSTHFRGSNEGRSIHGSFPQPLTSYKRLSRRHQATVPAMDSAMQTYMPPVTRQKALGFSSHPLKRFMPNTPANDVGVHKRRRRNKTYQVRTNLHRQ